MPWGEGKFKAKAEDNAHKCPLMDCEKCVEMMKASENPHQRLLRNQIIYFLLTLNSFGEWIIFCREGCHQVTGQHWKRENTTILLSDSDWVIVWDSFVKGDKEIQSSMYSCMQRSSGSYFLKQMACKERKLVHTKYWNSELKRCGNSDLWQHVGMVFNRM